MGSIDQMRGPCLPRRLKKLSESFEINQGRGGEGKGREGCWGGKKVVKSGLPHEGEMRRGKKMYFLSNSGEQDDLRNKNMNIICVEHMCHMETMMRMQKHAKRCQNNTWHI